MALARVAICSEDWYQGLNTQDRALVDEGVAKADAALQEWTKNAEAQGLADLRKAGMQVYVNTSADKARFAELIRPKYSEIVDEQIAKMFIKAAEENR